VVPTSGFWVPWLPFTLPQSFPFAYWTAFILDHFSRRLIAFAVFRSEPTAADIKTFFEHTIQAVGRAPKHLINDQGVQFNADLFTEFCKAKNIKQRFGAVGQHGSIAVIERFIRSFKEECIRFISVPLDLDNFRREIELYTFWYNVHRPHEFLKGLTPLVKYNTAPLTDSLCSGAPAAETMNLRKPTTIPRISMSPSSKADVIYLSSR